MRDRKGESEGRGDRKGGSEREKGREGGSEREKGREGGREGMNRVFLLIVFCGEYCRLFPYLKGCSKEGFCALLLLMSLSS